MVSGLGCKSRSNRRAVLAVSQARHPPRPPCPACLLAHRTPRSNQTAVMLRDGARATPPGCTACTRGGLAVEHVAYCIRRPNAHRPNLLDRRTACVDGRLTARTPHPRARLPNSAMAEPGPQAPAVVSGSDAENADPAEAEGTLKHLFAKGQSIATHRCRWGGPRAAEQAVQSARSDASAPRRAPTPARRRCLNGGGAARLHAPPTPAALHPARLQDGQPVPEPGAAHTDG